MSLKTRIEQEKDTIDGLEHAIKQARKELWSAEWVRKNDERWEGEDPEHWEARHKRHRHHVHNRDDIKNHLVKKCDAHRSMLDDLIEHRLELKEEHAEEVAGKFQKGGTRIVVFDGKPCVEDIAYWLQLCRDRGLWHGYLVSGYRTPEYSIQLCIRMCGQPSCPGTCAGATTNHAKTTYPGPAVDVTDYVQCERALYAVGAPYSNNLPNDLVHMSRSGF